MLDAKLHTLLDHLLRDLRAGEDEHCIGLFGDGLEIRVTVRALESSNARIHSIDLITTLLESFVSCIAACLALIRYANNGDLFLGEEVLYENIKLGHWISFRTETFIL